MALAHIQCFCGQKIGLASPSNSFSKDSILPQEFSAKCPCGRNWLLHLSQRNPSYKPGRRLPEKSPHAKP